MSALRSTFRCAVRTLVLCAACTLYVAGCGPSRESAVAAVAAHNDALRARASFDLNCPKDAIEFTPLKQYANAFHEDVKYMVLAGVTGCDRRATYVYDERRGLWILNMDAVPTTTSELAK